MKVYSSVEIDFESGGCHETFESKLKYVVNLTKALPNPYIGNKRKILFDILKHIDDAGIKYSSAIDLFSGSACISLVMKMLGKKVIANDILTSSCLYAKAFVQNNSIDLSVAEKEFLLYTNDTNHDSFVTKNFADRFTTKECEFLDSYWQNTKSLDSDEKRDLALANLQLYVMDKCFVGGRLNNGQVLARLDHRLKHARNDGYDMLFKDMRWYKFIDQSYSSECSASNMDAIELIKQTSPDAIDLIYIDPPYGGDQSDYASMFSFFESYLRRQVPQEWMNSGGFLKFCKSKDYENNFIDLMGYTSSFKNVVISYNDSSWSDIDTIKTIIERFKSEVLIKEIEYEYRYRDAKKKKGTEYLIIAR
jgi:adenine-specific DNA methylase